MARHHCVFKPAGGGREFEAHPTIGIGIMRDIAKCGFFDEVREPVVLRDRLKLVPNDKSRIPLVVLAADKRWNTPKMWGLAGGQGLA